MYFYYEDPLNNIFILRLSFSDQKLASSCLFLLRDRFSTCRFSWASWICYAHLLKSYNITMIFHGVTICFPLPHCDDRNLLATCSCLAPSPLFTMLSNKIATLSHQALSLYKNDFKSHENSLKELTKFVSLKRPLSLLTRKTLTSPKLFIKSKITLQEFKK